MKTFGNIEKIFMKDNWKVIIENIDFLKYCEKNHLEPLSLLLVDANKDEKIIIKRAFLGKPAERL